MTIASMTALDLLQSGSQGSSSAALVILCLLGVIALVVILARSRKGPERPKPLIALICGATGVGKSTLINSLIGRTVTAAGSGLPLTQNTFPVEDASGRYIFYDSKGLEVQDASQTYLLLMSDLLRLRFGPVARDQIDVVLMCIQEPQGRIDDAHLEIAALCEDLRIPLGIVITKTLDNPELERVVRATFARASFVRRVRALELKLGSVVVPAEGLNELVEDIRSLVSRVRDDSRNRVRQARGAQHLGSVARQLVATASGNDMAWVAFAGQAWACLGMQGPKWPVVLKERRKMIQKLLVPEFLERKLNTRFEVPKIEGAIARRSIPFIMRRFADGTKLVTPSDIIQMSTEALAGLQHERPYRSRF